MASVYISPTGNDTTGNGTSGNPWLTISKAFSSTSSGDTINCLAGTYTGNTVDDFGSARTIVGAGYATTIFDFGGVTVFWRLTSGITLTISGISFINGRGNAGSGTTVFNLAINNARVDFTDCSFTLSCDSTWGAFGTSNALGSGNTLTFTFLRCRFLNMLDVAGSTTQSAYFTAQSGTLIANLTSCTIYTNVAASATATIYWVNFAIHSALTDNIFYNANGTPHSFATAGVTYTGSNNDIVGYASNLPSLANQLATDPLFVDASNNILYLRPGSPCINTGI